MIDAVLERVREIGGMKELPCAEAFELAKKFEVKVRLIGRICNRYNIRISKCQLGCFA